MPSPLSVLTRSAWVLTGPTGSGKTELALRLAEAHGAEIIAMDSMTLYRGMDVGTAKPTSDDRERVPHHLIDVLDPWESANVAWWLEQAIACAVDIESRGKRVLFVGGTPLYLKALLHGLFHGPPADPATRQQLESDAEQQGGQALHSQLALVDPPTAARLHVNDLRRVIRALEVWYVTGRPISSFQGQWDDDSAPPDVRCWCIDRPREELYARINTRVDRMLAAGWIDEVRSLQALPQPLSREAGQALGYRELLSYLDGRADLETSAELIRTRSRQFSKRQLTWFRSIPQCHALPMAGDCWAGVSEALEFETG